MLSPLLTLTLIVFPSLANAGLFTSESPVKMLDGSKGFKSALRENRTAIVAFVAPWCGHCQKLTPEYERAAKRLRPLVPLYAVDCDAEHNKRLCAEQGVRGFPTLKIFKKGLKSPGVEYQGQRTNNDIYNWGKSAIPNTINKVRSGTEGVNDWAYKNKDKPRAILLNKTNKLPLLWVVLANQFDKKILFSTVRDRRGMVSKSMGFPVNEEHRKPKVIIYPPGARDPIMYEGLLKYEPLADFFKKFSRGKADLSKLLKSAKAEKDSMPEMEMRKQEADAIMQGKGYGNPHAGMQVGDDGLPIGDVHEGHSGADYMKAIKDAEEAAKAPKKAQKPLEMSEANFEGLEMGEEGEETVSDGFRDNADEL